MPCRCPKAAHAHTVCAVLRPRVESLHVSHTDDGAVALRGQHGKSGLQFGSPTLLHQGILPAAGFHLRALLPSLPQPLTLSAILGASARMRRMGAMAFTWQQGGHAQAGGGK